MLLLECVSKRGSCVRKNSCCCAKETLKCLLLMCWSNNKLRFLLQHGMLDEAAVQQAIHCGHFQRTCQRLHHAGCRCITCKGRLDILSYVEQAMCGKLAVGAQGNLHGTSTLSNQAML